MPLARELLAIEQSFSFLDIETDAREKLHQAVKAFWKDELTESANLFLESSRILQNEYERNLFTRLDSLPKRDRYQQQERIARENKGRILLSLVALHDFARACSRNNREYKDKDGEYKLKVCPPRYDWSGNTTTEELEIEENNECKPCPKGSAVTRVLPLKDTLGRLLEEAESFKEAALIIGSICSLQVACVSKSLKDHLDGYKFISDSLLWMSLQTSIAVAATRTASSAKTFGFEQIQEKKEDDTDEDRDNDAKKGKRRKLILKNIEGLKKKQEKGIPLSEEESEDLIALIEQFHVDRSTPYKALNGERGLSIFKWHGREDEYHKSFKQVQEKDDNSSEKDDNSSEKDDNSSEGDEEDEKYRPGRDEAELIALLEHFHVTSEDVK